MGVNTGSLGVTGGADRLLRDLIHERTGLFFDNGKGDILTDKLSPLVIERGFTSLLDYYYLLKYDEAAQDEWLSVMNALSVPETYFWREMDQVRALVETVVPKLVRRARRWAAQDLERGVRDGRGASDDRDGARRGGVARARADRDSRQRRQHGRNREGAARRLPRALVPQPAAGVARQILYAGGRNKNVAR